MFERLWLSCGVNWTVNVWLSCGVNWTVNVWLSCGVNWTVEFEYERIGKQVSAL
jgi:hypothetical protein